MLLGSRHSCISEVQNGMQRCLPGRHCGKFFPQATSCVHYSPGLMYIWQDLLVKHQNFFHQFVICPWVVFMFLLIPVVNRKRSGISMKWMGDYPY
jgi:hypothetical protein